MIHLNFEKNLTLPHIVLPEINAKLMIDTGSTRSFMSPEKTEQFFSQYKYYEPFQVISTHASSTHNEAIHIPLSKTFRSPESHTFYVYNVDCRYDGLIGSDLLKQLEANVDMKNLILKTKTTMIPIIYSPPQEYKLRSEEHTSELQSH